MADIYDQFTPRDVALAVAASNQIMIEHLFPPGPKREAVERDFRAKSQELLTQQFEERAAQLLMVMCGVVQPK